MAPKVSVVTCSYNRPGYLRVAVESLRAQTDSDWEHLIYDDCSTDRGVDEVLEWALKDPRVRVWRGQENLDRPAVLWNFMMDRALGRYLAVLDDDNEKLPSFVATMSRELDADPGLDVVTCGFRVDREHEGPVDYYLNLSTAAERLATQSTCDGGAMLYRREAWERAGYFSEALRTNEDWDWLRRAVQNGRVKNLHEVHSTYRVHAAARMKRATGLGNDADVDRVRARVLSSGIGIRAVCPPYDRLTQSQRDVCDSIGRGLAAIPWVHAGNDVCMVVSPFQKSGDEVAAAVAGAPVALSVHMEDPYALVTNLDRVQRMNNVTETWVCTNDASCVPYYQKVVGDRVMVSPSLSADHTMPSEAGAREIDVLLCGYAYPSRKRFVTELLPLLAGFSVTLVGDGWESHGRSGVSAMPTQPLVDSYRFHARARAVICLHRVRGDCSDSAVDLASVNRGWLEGYAGARVFIDKTRPLHAFDEGDVVWYDTPRDLADKLRRYLVSGDASPAFMFAEKCRTLYTYRARLARMLNCIRSPRYLAEIP